jgi:hypothetical protein
MHSHPGPAFGANQTNCNLPNGIDDVAAIFTKSFIAKPKEPYFKTGCFRAPL